MWYLAEALACAWPGNAESGIHCKQSTVAAALNPFMVVVQKLIWLPVELQAQVRAAVQVDENLLLMAYGQQRNTTELKAQALIFE